MGLVPYVVMWYEIFVSIQENVAVEQLDCEHQPNTHRVVPFCNLYTWSHIGK